MIIECHSSQPKCLSFPICHPIINCCPYPPTKCICITNCYCPATPSMTSQTDNCKEKLKNKLNFRFKFKRRINTIYN